MKSIEWTKKNWECHSWGTSDPFSRFLNDSNDDPVFCQLPCIYFLNAEWLTSLIVIELKKEKDSPNSIYSHRYYTHIYACFFHHISFMVHLIRVHNLLHAFQFYILTHKIFSCLASAKSSFSIPSSYIEKFLSQLFIIILSEIEKAQWWQLTVSFTF